MILPHEVGRGLPGILPASVFWFPHALWNSFLYSPHVQLSVSGYSEMIFPRFSGDVLAFRVVDFCQNHRIFVVT